jgi:hypothetical protein
MWIDSVSHKHKIMATAHDTRGGIIVLVPGAASFIYAEDEFSPSNSYAPTRILAMLPTMAKAN